MHRALRDPAGMNATTTSIASVLNSLIATCKDGQEGFRTAAEKVKSADLKALFSELSMQRREFAGELQLLVTDLGEEAETSGSVSGALRRGWMNLKAALTSGDEHAILAVCESGEDSAVAAYREALEHEDLPDGVRDLIQRQYICIQAAHDRVRALRDRFAR
jgi:uncharacterized protein (TIGR02284 family)